jgi:succinoglycan biosynthesis protein ExoO
LHPEVSFIIPGYNVEEFITRAVSSVLAQTLQNFEVVLVNDGSTDRTASIMAQLAASDPRVRFINLNENRGPSAARNAALAEATGEWLSVVDADDQISPDRTVELLKIALSTSADIVADNLELIDGHSGAVLATAFPQARNPYHFQVTDSEYVRRNRMDTPGFKFGYLKPVFRRSLIERGGVRYDERVRIGEDYMLCLRALLSGARFIITSRAMYQYTMRLNSISRQLLPSDISPIIEAHQDIMADSQLTTETQGAIIGANQGLMRLLTLKTIVDNVKHGRLISAGLIATTQPAVWPLAVRSGFEATQKRLARLLRMSTSVPRSTAP